MDVLDVVVETCADVAMEVWLFKCAEVARLEEDEKVNVSVVPEEVEVVEAVLDNTEKLAAVD